MALVGKLTPFPDENVPIEQKETPEYGCVIGQAIYDRYLTGGYSPITTINRDWYAMMSLYFDGKQPRDQYVAVYRGYGTFRDRNTAGPNYSIATPEGGDYDRKGYNNISFDVVSPAPKMVGIISSLLNEADQMVDIKSLSPHALRQKELAKWKLYYGSKVINPLREKMGLEARQYDWRPANMQELEIYEKNHGFKLPFETGLLHILKHTFEISNWGVVFENMKKYLIQNHFVCGRVKTNNEGAVVVEYIPPSNYITAYLEKQSLDEAPFAGHIERVQISELIPILEKMGVTEAEIKGLARENSGINGITDPTNFDFNWTDPATSKYLWYEWYVAVLHFEMRSNDEERWRKYKKKDGAVRYARMNPKKKPDGKGYYYDRENNPNTLEVDVIKNQVVYEGSWVIGTKWIYNYQRQKNVLKNSDGTAALSYFHYNVPGQSIIERWKPMLDQYMMYWLKLQAAVLAAKPDGSIIDMGVLANIDLGFGIMQPLQIARIENETGNLFIQTNDAMMKNRVNAASAVMPKPGGPGQQVESWLALMQSAVNSMRDVSGLTASVEAGSSGQPELVGLMQGEMLATNNAMYPMKKALIELKECIAKKIVSKARMLIEFNPKSREYYSGVIGEKFIKEIELYKDLSLNQIGIIMRAAPTEQRKERIRQYVEVALSEGRNGVRLIDFEDALLIEKYLDEGYIDMAIWHFSVTRQRNLARQQAIDMQNMQANAQVQMQSAQAAQEAKTQAEMAIKKLEGDIEMSRDAQKIQAELALEQVRHQNKMAELALQGRIDTVHAMNQKAVSPTK